MFDIIRDGVSFDFGYIYTMPMDKEYPTDSKKPFYNKKKNWTTEYAKFESASEKGKLGSLVEAIRDVAAGHTGT